jgi:hypothetical protein
MRTIGHRGPRSTEPSSPVTVRGDGLGERGYHALMSATSSPVEAVQRLADAVAVEDTAAYDAAIRDLFEAVQASTPADIEATLVRLRPLLADIPLGIGSGLARLTGAIVDKGADPALVLDILVERACDAMETAERFRALHRQLLGEPPDSDDPSAVKDTFERFVAACAGRPDPAPRLVWAWFTGLDWVQPVLYLSQRADVRAALPQRERLLAAVESTRDVFGTADWLYGLLLVLDDAPLIVVHRATGLGYRITIGGIGDNFQLHTLLAARLIGDPAQGWLPGTRPTAEMIAAADGSGDPQPEGGIVGQFNLVDPYGGWLWNEGRPADIPLFEGERVVVLDPPPYERSWNAGRVYPLMQPSLRIAGRLSPAEAAALLAKARPADPGQAPPIGWTDDLTIAVPAGRSVAEVVDIVLQGASRGLPAEDIERSLVAGLGLNADDAALARDRALGGVVRAATRNPANCPPRDKDPVAFESYQRATADPSLISRIYPEFGPR